MSYSQKRHPNRQDEFPAPPMYLVWVADLDWTHNGSAYHSTPLNEGQVRHHPDLAKCKKHVSGYCSYGSDEFRTDWAIYKWDGTKYLKEYEGKAGGLKGDNPLYKTRVKKGSAPAREVDADDLEEVLQSIARVFTEV